MDCGFSQTLEFISTTSEVLFTALSAFAAVYAYKWSREKIKIDAQKFLAEQRWNYNSLLMNYDELKHIEIDRHPWGKINKEDIGNMVIYFTLLNASVTLWQAHKLSAVEEGIYESAFNHLANRTHRDREFIKQHILPRGYPKLYREELIQRWEKIDKEGHLKPA